MNRVCDCEIPEDHGKFRPGFCRFCGGKIDPRWLSNDDTAHEYLTQLAVLPDVDPRFIDQCHAREQAGRQEFGNSFLARDNCYEGLEEASDLSNYAAFHILQRRRHGKSERIDLALKASWHAAQAYAALIELHHAE